MTRTIEAVFDGAVLRPSEPLNLREGARVQITFEDEMSGTDDKGQPRSFLQTARSLQLDGPPDWSSHLDVYLYGDPNIKND
jgi:predicted DNA-binding antitoxin AbrB/MazE fold protein